ncbi:hypothetical protein GJAV_G00274210 [Gymnothorax javanicus]|nr:hypothetical protein GJAV_G00274210 [Gymnothorax javanicus]
MIRIRPFFDSYEHMAEFNSSTLSLLLKNVRLTDSGIYEAEIRKIKGKPNVTTYRLSVEEAPPIPQVRVALLFSDGEFCNVSVNCSAEDTRASYTCDHAKCILVENKTSQTGINLTVTATNGTIHCNSKNHVATKTQSESTNAICQSQETTRKKPNYIIPIAVSVIIAALIIIVVIIIIIIRKRRRRSEGTQVVTQISTDYATVETVGLQNLSTVETMYDVVTTAKPEGPPQVNTVYDTLGPPGDNSAKPESIYATVNKSAA